MLTTVSFYRALPGEWCDPRWKTSILQPFLVVTGALCSHSGANILLYGFRDPENAQLLSLCPERTMFYSQNVGGRSQTEIWTQGKIQIRFMVFLGTSLKCGFESSELFPERPNSAMQRSVDIHTVPVIKSKPPLSAHADGASGMLTWASLPRTLGIEEPRGQGRQERRTG